MTTTTSRRAILAGAAALPALTIPCTANPAPDPIFAAIERHREARAVWWEPVPGETDQESDDRINRTAAAAERTLADVISTKPTTIAGCVALLRHVHDHLAVYEGEEAHILSNAAGDTGASAEVFLLLIATAVADAAVQS